MRDRSWTWVLSALFLFGAWLRTAQLGSQTLFDDELYAVFNAVRFDFRTIFTHFGGNDYCIPLTLFGRLAFLTIGLSEPVFQLPPLLFGTATVAVFAWLVRRPFGSVAALIFAWLLAVSPYHIALTRFARPYSISLFLVFVGVFACHRFHVKKDRRAGWLYVACTVLATYFHLSFVVVALLPLVACTALEARRKGWRIGPYFKLGAWIACALALLLLPPVLGDPASLLNKVGKAPLRWETIAATLPLFLGQSASSPAFWAAVVLAAFGVREGFRRDRLLSGMLLGLAGSQLLYSLITRPVESEFLAIFARYNFFSLPVLLLFVALGIEGLAREAGRRARFPQWALVAGICLLLPLQTLNRMLPAYSRLNQWISMSVMMTIFPLELDRVVVPRGKASSFYETLKKLPPGSTPIIEVPTPDAPLPQLWRQMDHQQPVVIEWGVPSDPPLPMVFVDGPGFSGLRNHARLSDPLALKTRGVRFVIFHRDLTKEFIIPPGLVYESPPVQPWIDLYRKQVGPPIFEDQDLVVFEVRAG